MSPLRTDATEADVQDWCCAYLARTLRLRAEKIDRMATFASIGLDSADSLFLVSALEDWSGLVLIPRRRTASQVSRRLRASHRPHQAASALE